MHSLSIPLYHGSWAWRKRMFSNWNWKANELLQNISVCFLFGFAYSLALRALTSVLNFINKIARHFSRVHRYMNRVSNWKRLACIIAGVFDFFLLVSSFRLCFASVCVCVFSSIFIFYANPQWRIQWIYASKRFFD